MLEADCFRASLGQKRRDMPRPAANVGDRPQVANLLGKCQQQRAIEWGLSLDETLQQADVLLVLVVDGTGIGWEVGLDRGRSSMARPARQTAPSQPLLEATFPWSSLPCD